MSLEFIESVLAKLAKERPLFWSEADFQFAFAWAIKKDLGDSVKIELERRFTFPEEDSDKYYVDIWIEYNGKIFPIELKYKTKRCDSCGITTIDQSANDVGRYLYLWDIHRLEKIKETITNFGEGYAIMLTNDSNYYNRPKGKRSEVAVDHLFRIHERPVDDVLFPISTDIRWDLSQIDDSKKTNHWTTDKNLNRLFTLEKPFSVDWKLYPQKKDSNLELKYLVNVVGKGMDSQI